MKSFILTTCISLILSASLAVDFPNDLFFVHHPDIAEAHAKGLYQVSNNYAQGRHINIASQNESLFTF